MADVWTGIRADPLYRDHINKVRKRMREFTKRERQLRLDLEGKKDSNGSNPRLVARDQA